MESGLAVCAVSAHFQIFTGNFNNKTKTHADPYRINVRLQDRSGETRTRGLLLPKQARYQLRNTPERYLNSIPFFAAFVNPGGAKKAGESGRKLTIHPIFDFCLTRQEVGGIVKMFELKLFRRKQEEQRGRNRFGTAAEKDKADD